MSKLKYKIASIIIFIISGVAFAASFIQSIYIENISNLRGDITKLEADHKKMELTANYLRTADINFYFTGLDYSDEAKWLDYEFEQLNDTLTNDERKVYVFRISSLLQKSINYRDLTSIIKIYRHFNESTTDLTITTEEIEGFNYTIPYDLWQSFVSLHGSPVIEMNASETYGHFFSFDYIQSRPLIERPIDLTTGREIFMVLQFPIGILTDFFLLNPVISLQGEINDKLNKVDILESEASIIALGVSLTTVAVVVSSVIANRLSDKKLERKVDELKAETTREKDSDLIPMLILVIATFLCILGLFLPYILNLF